jgi:DNA-binding NtrC family response regulator
VIQAQSRNTILLGEHEVIARMMLAQYLRECGYTVLEAANTEEAMALLKAPEVRVDIVLCAVDLSGAVGGFALARTIRAETPGIKFILTGNTAGAANAAGELCEEGPLLKKPYDHQLLVDQIKRLLAQRDRK